MRVLVACEESQEVCKAFRARGHEAYSCDIQECSGGYPEWHIQDDVLKHLDGWDLIIAHPPCTYLSAVGTRHLYGGGYIHAERFNQGLKAADFFHKMLNAPCDKICVENPVPFKIFGLPKYTQIIHPYYFGDPFDKRTCLWLKGLPNLVPDNMLSEYNNCSQRKGEKGKSWYTQGGKNRQKTVLKHFRMLRGRWLNSGGNTNDI